MSGSVASRGGLYHRGTVVRLVIEILGDKIIEREFMEHRGRAINPIPVFEVLAQRFLAIETLQFNTQGMSGSGGWRPLSAAYLAEKIRHGYDPRILHRTLRLRESLTNSDAPGSIKRITPEFMEVGTDVTNDKGFPYPAVHQQGRGVPVRKPVDLTLAERRRWVKTVQRYIVNGELVFGGGAAVPF